MRKEKSEPKASSSPPSKGPKAFVYVVDDEPMLLELALTILEPEGYKVASFQDPREALKQFSSANPKPDIIVSDFAMHTMDGLGLLKSCRKIQPKQKFLLVSGTVDETAYDYTSEKPDQFLAKPYDAETLIRTVRAVLSH
jgi:two-component system, cell cycle sensor histidine kinase and response regulator CckA